MINPPIGFVPIKDYEGLYWINKDGQIFSNKLNGIKKCDLHNGHYKKADLYKNNKSKSIRIHRLVATTFISNPNNLPTVNHKDGNKLNNSVNNLEWMSYSDNNKHALLLKLRKCEYKIKKNEYIFIERLISSGFSQKEVSEVYNVTQSNISYILRRKNEANFMRFREDRD